MLKVDHIGIAVKNLPESIELFEKLLATPCYKTEEVVLENVQTAFFKKGTTKIELVASLQKKGGDDLTGGGQQRNVIDNFIEKKGEGMHHIAFEVEDIFSEMDRLVKEGFTLLHETPKKGADNKLICFLHPKSTNGVLIELCQEIHE